MKMKNFLNSNFQELYEKEVYNKIEEAIKNNDYDKLSKLYTEEEGNIDLTHDEGHLGILAANDFKILNFLVDKCPALVEMYGKDILTAAAWTHNDKIVSFLINEKFVNHHELEGTNIYDYCVQASGNSDSHSEDSSF